MEKRKNQILIVDNEPAILLAFRKLLTTARIVVHTAETFEEALLKIDNNEYLAVVADLRLTGVGGKEGLDILNHIKKRNSRIFFILITGYGNPEIRERALADGADGYFEKPVSCARIQEALAQLGVPYQDKSGYRPEEEIGEPPGETWPMADLFR